MLEIGSLVDGKYKILNKVGQGGMSVVYLAMNEKANKQWAVKEVRKDGIRDFEVVEKHHVELPDEIVGIVRCGNPKCITNNEPMRTRFTVAHDRNSLTLRCNYCCKEVRSADVQLC